METKGKTATLRIGGHRADSKGRYTYAVISREDHDRLSRFKWSIHSAGYAYRLARVGNKMEARYLHREVMNLQRGQGVVDHLSGDPLDCRRENLRVLESNAHNLQNRRKGRGASGFRGVHRSKKNSTWIATVRHMGETFYGGSFQKEIDAALSAEILRRSYLPYALPDSKLVEEFGEDLDQVLADWQKENQASF